MNKQCLDVQQMQHLQELGMELKKDTILVWARFMLGKTQISDWEIAYNHSAITDNSQTIPAYTLQDVLDALPKYYHIANIGWTKLSIRVHTTKEWEIGYVYTDELSKYVYGCRILSKELIDAAYELFCWCVEWGFVETNKNE